MLTRELGRTGVRIPAIGQGTWRMGERRERAAREIEALRLGIDLGMTLIDTAEMYADGGAERVVAEAGRDRRDQVFLVTKVLPGNASHQGVLRAAEASRRRLDTDWIDLYLLHWPSRQIPIAETMGAMEALIDRGHVRYLGISNFDTRETREVERVLQRHPLTCNQLYYHLEEKAVEYSLLPHCEAQGITVMAYSPLGQGSFPPPGEGGELLRRIGEKHGRTAAQVALNYLSRRERVVAIPKASDPGHVQENAASTGWELSAEDVAAMDAAFPPPDRERPLPIR